MEFMDFIVLLLSALRLLFEVFAWRRGVGGGCSPCGGSWDVLVLLVSGEDVLVLLVSGERVLLVKYDQRAGWWRGGYNVANGPASQRIPP